jgi:hypothetical protein
MSTMMFFSASNAAGISFTASLDPAAGPNPIARFWLYRLIDATHSQLIGDSGPTMGSSHTFAVSAADIAVWGTNYAVFEVDAQPALRGAASADVLLTVVQNGAPVANENPQAGKDPNYLMTLTQDAILNAEGFGLRLI